MDQISKSTPLATAALFNAPRVVGAQRTSSMSKSESAAAVARLREALDAAFAAVPAEADPSAAGSAKFAQLMRAALAQAAAEDALLTPAQREGAADCYRRHLVVADPHGRYTAAALVWQPGQASPVHGHHTWCGYTVLEGALHETLYEWDGDTHCAAPVRAHAREAGAVSYVRAGLTAIHRLANTSSRPALSLHVYGVHGEQIATHVNRLVAAAAEPSLHGR
jgi:predicted metal-dependent enzyme (double-stranded beta helix superfamily)